MNLSFQIVDTGNFTEEHRKIVADMLRKQGKVRGALERKIDRCKSICLVKLDEKFVGLGAIKMKTSDDFRAGFANLEDLSNDFEFELGYFFTDTECRGQGIASSVVKLLLDHYGDGNIMASTEICPASRMVGILEKSGFRQLGNLWKSRIHQDYLGLFLRFNAKQLLLHPSGNGCNLGPCPVE